MDSNKPVINYTKRNETSRDTLGIDSVAASIQTEICPIVNNVTPKPYYWAFIMWCYYDWYKENPNDRTRAAVNKYIKKTNYYIALGNILAGKYGVGSYTGSQNIMLNYTFNNGNNQFIYDENYIKNLSNMQYYPPGLETLGMLVYSDESTGQSYTDPKIRKNDGEKLAKEFEDIISKTRYYKEYRKKNVAIPKDVLIELANTVNYDLCGFDSCKETLRLNLFEKKARQKLRECSDYINYVKKTFGIDLNDEANCRQVGFDYFSPRGKNKNIIPKELEETALNWELLAIRQYFVVALETLWAYMLLELNGLYTKKKWFEICIKDSNKELNYSKTLDEFIQEYHLDSTEIERILNYERIKSNNHFGCIDNFIKVLLSAYNRVQGREDFNYRYICLGDNKNSISIKKIIDTVNKYKNKPTIEFIYEIMSSFLVDQHMRTAYIKMLDGRDGYYITEIENCYMRKRYYDVDFKGIRLVRLYSVMKDLGTLYE